MHPLDITEVKIRYQQPRVDDLIGWASCLVDGCLFVNNIMIKEGRDGVYLHFPKIAGRPHFFFNPVNQAALDAFTEAVLERLEKDASHDDAEAERDYNR